MRKASGPAPSAMGAARSRSRRLTMAAAKEAKDPTVTPVRSAGLTAIVGTLDEKVRAFQQMGSAASSGLFPAGYDTVQKIQAACWFGDGLGVHPTIYMEGVQP